jgi:hypothetical protein
LAKRLHTEGGRFESKQSIGSESTFRSDLLLIVRCSNTQVPIVVAGLLCYPADTLCSQCLEPPGRARKALYKSPNLFFHTHILPGQTWNNGKCKRDKAVWVVCILWVVGITSLHTFVLWQWDSLQMFCLVEICVCHWQCGVILLNLRKIVVLDAPNNPEAYYSLSFLVFS